MLLSVSVLCFNQVEATRRCLATLRRWMHVFNDVELILTDNGSSDCTLEFLEALRVPNKKIIRHPMNIGFGPGHNEALKQASGEHFMCMNNDMELLQPEWKRIALAPLKDQAVGLVGLDGSPCTLRPDGTGFVGPHRDYIEASFVVGRTAQFREYGLFSPAIKMFVCEDSDLSLRFRQMGFKLSHVNIRHRHAKSTTLRTIDKDEKDRIVIGNMRVLNARWKGQFISRSFSNRILIRIPSIGIGDIVCATSAVSGVRRDHPTAHITVETRFPGVFANNPNVNETRTEGADAGFDRIVNLSPDFKKPVPLFKLCETLAATCVGHGRPELYLSDQEKAKARTLLANVRRQFDALLVYSPLMSRVEWEGRNWTAEQARRLKGLLHGSGIGLVEIGAGVEPTGCADLCLVGQTDLRTMFAVVEASDGYVGIDSLPMHVAQAFGKQMWVIFGATKPISRIVDFRNTSIIRRDELSCLGCYQRGPGPGIHKCLRGDEACMKGVRAETVAEAILRPDLRHAWNVNYLHRLALEGMTS
ncbi:MAG: glycosyltransferase [Patescibacteria group bacterium]